MSAVLQQRRESGRCRTSEKGQKQTRSRDERTSVRPALGCIWKKRSHGLGADLVSGFLRAAKFLLLDLSSTLGIILCIFAGSF